jgi:hypothetical protein
MTTATARSAMVSWPPVPDARTLMRLFAGGLAGLLVWEVWARYATPPVAGFPLEPPELVRTLIEHQTGIAISLPLATVLHYIVGIAGYPIAYWVVSRGLRRWGAVLDIGVWAIFSVWVGYLGLMGKITPFIAVFWVLVTALSATRFVNPHSLSADALSWGSFTWFNALGIMAPLAGQPFLLLTDYAPLSFMSWAGHVIYGAVAVLLFEGWQLRRQRR